MSHRFATHCTEADGSIQNFQEARRLGMETIGSLMLSHRTTPENLARQARIMADAGCQCVYVVDSADALILKDLSEHYGVPAYRILEEIGRAGYVGGQENMIVDVAVELTSAKAR